MSNNKKTTLVGTALMMKRKKGREEGDKKKRKSPKLQLALSDKKLRNPRAEYLVVPSESRSLPWCLFAKTESDTLTPYPGHVSDFVIRNLLAEFKTLAAQKIVDVLCNTSEEVFSLEPVFAPSRNTHLHQAVASLVRVARHHCIIFTIKALLLWREYQYSNAAKEYYKKRCADKQNGKSAGSHMVAKPSKEPQGNLDERFTLMIEYLFVTTCLAVLEARLNTNPLNDAQLQALLTVAIDQAQLYVRPTTTTTTVVVDNKTTLFNLYSCLLGVLSKNYFTVTTDRVWDAVPGLISSRSKALPQAFARIEALKYVDMQVSDQLGVDETLAFLTKYCSVLKSSKLSKEARLLLSQTIVSLLERIAAQPLNPEVDYLELHRLLAGLYDTFSATKRKQRDTQGQTWYPLLSALLASADEEFFTQHWLDLCNNMSRPLRDKGLRPFLLQSIKLLVDTYCQKFSRDTSKLASILDQLCVLVFPSKITKSSITFQGESVPNLELFVDVILAIARRDLDYSMRKIVFEFIRADKLRGDSQPEKVYIAVRAIFGIHDLIKSNMLHSPCSLTQSPDATTNSEQKTADSMISEYMPSICDFFSQLLRSLDGIFGNWLLFNQSRSVDDLLQREKLNGQSFILLRNCLDHIPPILPSGLKEGELVALLARYLVHIDQDIRERAWNVLSALMRNSEDHRPHIIYGMSKYLLSIPDLKAKLLCGVMQKLLKVVNFWIFASSSARMQASGAKLDLGLAFEIEGICLLYLCNESVEVRDLALELLIGIRRLSQPAHEIQTDAVELPPTWIIDIIEESGPDIIQRLQNDFRFNAETPFPLELDSVSFKTLAVSKHQLCWAFCLGELAMLVRDLCPEVVVAIRKVFATRVEELARTGIPNETEGLLGMWRNYLTVTCIFTLDLTEARDLFTVVSPFFKMEPHRDAIVFALQRVHISTMEVLAETLKSYENESGAKKAKKRDRVRHDMGQMYGALSERFPHLFLRENEKVRQFYAHFVNDSLTYLTDSLVGEDSILLRYNFCSVVYHISTQLHESAAPEAPHNELDIDIRLRLFKLFSHWTQRAGGSETVLSDTAKKRKTNPTALEGSVFKVREQAAYAISAILRGVSFTKESPFSPSDPVLQWVQFMRKSERPELARIAVEALAFYMQGNRANPELTVTALRLCYSFEKEVADAYFLAIVELYRMNGTLSGCTSAVLFHLILFKLGDGEVLIRRSAIQLLHILAEQGDEENWATTYSPCAINGYLFEVYQHAQLDLSRRLADDYPDLAFEVFDEFVYRLDSADSLHQKLMLQYLIAWVKKMNLGALDHMALCDFLKNLFWVTIKYNGDPHHFTHLVAVWETLAGSHPDNIPLIIDLVLSIGVNKRNRAFIPLAKRVVSFLAHTDSQAVIDYLVNELATGSRSKSGSRTIQLSESNSSLSMIHEDERPTQSRFDEVMSENKSYFPPARGHFALLLLTELSFLPTLANQMASHLPILLHQVFLGLDNANALVYSHCNLLLQNLVQMLIVEKLEELADFQENELYLDGIFLLEFLRSKSDMAFWDREDLSEHRPHLGSAEQLVTLVAQTMNVLGDKYVELRTDWGAEALAWAIGCPDYHWRCRSFQIYRALNPQASPEILDNLLSSLCKWLPSDDNGCGIELEILYTLQIIASTANTNRLVLFNQIFWSAVALLRADFEVIFTQAVTLLSIILDRVNFHDKAVRHVFLASRPKNWPSEFLGIQPMLLRGLLSSVSEAPSIDVLVKITPLPGDEIFQPDPTRLLTNVLALQPWLCAYMLDPQHAQKTQVAANFLSKKCEEAAHPALASVYTRLPVSVHEISVFLSEWSEAFAAAFFPQYGVFTFVLLIELLRQGPSKYHRAILCIIQLLTKCIDVNREEFNPRIPQWFGLVSQYICSEIWKEGLLVLESAVQQSPLQSPNIEIETLRPFRTHKREPVFSNDISEGNILSAQSLEKVLSFADSTKVEESNIFPRAFDKFFSEDDIAGEDTSIRTTHDDEESGEHHSVSEETAEDYDDEDEESMHLGDRMYERPPDMHNFGLDVGMEFGHDRLNSFPSFDGLDDILSDLSKELAAEGSFDSISSHDSPRVKVRPDK